MVQRPRTIIRTGDYKATLQIYHKANRVLKGITVRTHATTQESSEMYLKSIAELGGDREPVAIGLLAERLEISTVSVGEMIKRLEARALVRHERYKGVSLTPTGAQAAAAVIRRQRLWECFLIDQLQLNWAGAYEMACRLEHATSSVLSEALAAYLDHPTHCPHGNPIPAADGSCAPLDAVPLTTLSPGTAGVVRAILPATTEIYAYLQQRRILPGTAIKLIARDARDGSLALLVDGVSVSVGQTVATLVYVAAGAAPAQSAVGRTLDSLPVGQTGRIVQIGGSRTLRRQLMEMGLLRGETIRVERSAPLGDPVEYVVKGYHLSLRRADARHIIVAPLSAGGEA